MEKMMDKKYCLGVGATSKANSVAAINELQKKLDLYKIQFTYISTLEKFAHSDWLTYLQKYFSVPILLFSKRYLQQYQSQIITPPSQILQNIGYVGVAESVALAAFKGNADLIYPKTICSCFTYAISCENV